MALDVGSEDTCSSVRYWAPLFNASMPSLALSLSYFLPQQCVNNEYNYLRCGAMVKCQCNEVVFVGFMVTECLMMSFVMNSALWAVCAEILRVVRLTFYNAGLWDGERWLFTTEVGGELPCFLRCKWMLDRRYLASSAFHLIRWVFMAVLVNSNLPSLTFLVYLEVSGTSRFTTAQNHVLRSRVPFGWPFSWLRSSSFHLR